MKILMVSSFLPYPLINGGNVRLYNLLKNLSEDYQITLVCEKRNFQTNEDIKEVGKFCEKVITVERKKQWTISNILKSFFSLNPFLVVGHSNPEMKRVLARELKTKNYDLIHVETFYVLQNLPRTKLPVILVEHNVEYKVYQKYVDHSHFFMKPFLSWDVLKMKKMENSFWGKAKVLIAVSEKEKKLMNANAVVQNGVDIKKFKVQSPKLKFQEKEKRILFIGDFKWLENRDVAKWIIKKIWPELKSKIDSKVKLWIIGRNILDSIKNLTQDPNVIFDENASKDTSLIYKKTFLLLSPIRIGGGTSFKILEAMASGVPVVTTSLGAEGITSGNEIVKADSVQGIVDSVLKLFGDKNYYEVISNKARKLIEEKYDWKKITKKLEYTYRNVVKND